MLWRTAGKRGLTLIVLVALGIAAALGYEFYAPIIGQIAVGNEAEARPAVPRDRAAVKVEACMAKNPGQGLPTLADVVRFYGLEEDTIECSVHEKYGEAASPSAILILAKHPLKYEEEIILCLD